MVDQGMIEEAQEVLEMYPQIADSVTPVTSKQLEDEIAYNQATYLQFPLPLSAITVVADQASLAIAREQLQACKQWSGTRLMDNSQTVRVIPMVEIGRAHV